MTKTEKINAALSNERSVYIHGIGSVGNGMRIDSGKCYLSKYPYDEDQGSYYGEWTGNMDGIDRRRRVEIWLSGRNTRKTGWEDIERAKSSILRSARKRQFIEAPSEGQINMIIKEIRALEMKAL